MTTVKIHFLPDNVTTSAKTGESWLAVAARAGVHISTGCLAGACHACEITIVKNSTAQAAAPEKDREEEPVLACLQSVPQGAEHIEVNLLDDPTW
jgi:ferredoxin